ncbi:MULTISPECIES: hypothetical protein [unclassified Sphingosinithalassobacter]|uniref:hypothetical protein n=1 Tax=unclassified Sphingosinithalassobacter TaxID=2676235 RepID=UPI00165E9491|nr:hypothetical protein [Sphingosinithalassobacter sp. CS137]
MKSACALLKNGKVYTQAFAGTDNVVWISYGPVFVSDYGDIEAMTEHLRAALEVSTQGVPYPKRDEWPLVQKPMLDAVGAKDWRALARGAKAVGIDLEDGVVTLSPSANYEDEGGSDRSEKNIRVEFDSSALGRRLLDAFEACI